MMKRAEQVAISNFDYLLPEERIARHPLQERDSSKLLHFEGCKISDKSFCDIPSILRSTDQLYFNATRVVQARLLFRKKTGAAIEIFCLEPYRPMDYQLAFSQREEVTFICMVGNAKKWKGEVLEMNLGSSCLYAEKIGMEAGKPLVKFSWSGELSFGEVLEKAGNTPIPPYLNRKAEEGDIERYQTVYAKQDGSVAAPTAGLHFTDRVLEELRVKGVETNELILHVGAGTFVPVKDENAMDHRMHAEHVIVTRELLASMLQSEGRRIAVGTTSTRSLESIYWLGVKAYYSGKDFRFGDSNLGQWEAYDLDGMGEESLSLEEAISALQERMDDEERAYFSFETSIMINPGYEFRVIDGLVTNFHQPKSTLLLLISALVGDAWKEIYSHAMKNGYRFLSYGDSSVLFQ